MKKLLTLMLALALCMLTFAGVAETKYPNGAVTFICPWGRKLRCDGSPDCRAV